MPFQGPRVSGVKTGKFYAANHNPHNACGFGASSVTETDLIRFVDAQAQIYSQVVEELTDGHNRTHWMWFIFPQLSGLGHSAMAQRYAIRDMNQAARYLADPILGERLRHDVRRSTFVRWIQLPFLCRKPDPVGSGQRIGRSCVECAIYLGGCSPRWFACFRVEQR